MNKYQHNYYKEMISRERGMPIYIDNKLVGIITYYIGKDDPGKYIRENPWSILEDEPDEGTVCYIDQAIGKEENKIPYSLKAFSCFINFIKERYPLVEYIRWNRFKNGRIFVYRKYLNRKEQLCIR